MKLRSLLIKSFRNINDLKLDFNDSSKIIFIGKNGSGKTSIIESIFLLSNKKSFRGSENKHLISWGSNNSTIEGLFDTDEGEKKFTLTLENNQKFKRIIKVNDNNITKASDFYSHLKCIVFTPDLLQVVKGSPQIRRDFFDRIILNIEKNYIDILTQFEKAKKERNKLLKDLILEGSANRDQLIKKLLPWTGILAELSIVISNKRAEYINLLSSKISKTYQFISNNKIDTNNEINIEKVEIFFESKIVGKSLHEVIELINLSVDRDIILGSSCIGAHKDKIILKGEVANLNTKTVQEIESGFFSQGQIRTLALSLIYSALVLVKEQTGETPILLLDDLISELDEERKDQLIDLINQTEAQVFITTTESFRILDNISDKKIFTIKNGEIS